MCHEDITGHRAEKFLGDLLARRQLGDVLDTAYRIGSYRT